jgi:hypothetical protein
MSCVTWKTMWLFDRKVLHDGMENTYEFNKDGQRYRLEPMVEEETTDNG